MPAVEFVSGGFGTEAQSSKVQEFLTAQNRSKRRPFTPFEQRQVEEGRANPYFIYNVSPVHEWSRPQGQLGTIIIQKRGWKDRHSAAAIIPGVTVRWARLGVSELQTPFIEGGDEIVADVVGVSPSYDVAHPNRDLTRYGVFFTRQPLELTQDIVNHLPEERRKQLANKDAQKAYVLSDEEREIMLEEAKAKLLDRLQETILEADNYFDGGPELRKFVQKGGPIYRDSLRAFNEITGQKVARPWTTLAASENMESCPFCGVQIRPNLAKCPSCKEIINTPAYEKLKKKIEGK